MFGKQLFIARKQKGLTLEELAKIYNEQFNGNLSKGMLSKYEHEKNEPMISTVANLAAVLGVSVDFLTGGAFYKPPETLSSDQKQLIEYYNNLNDSEKKFIIATMEYISTSNKR